MHTFILNATATSDIYTLSLHDALPILRIGNTSLLVFSPLGSSTSGTLYVAAHRGPQMAIRVFGATGRVRVLMLDRKSTRLNSSHSSISYAVFCLKKKNKKTNTKKIVTQ